MGKDDQHFTQDYLRFIELTWSFLRQLMVSICLPICSPFIASQISFKQLQHFISNSHWLLVSLVFDLGDLVIMAGEGASPKNPPEDVEDVNGDGAEGSDHSPVPATPKKPASKVAKTPMKAKAKAKAKAKGSPVASPRASPRGSPKAKAKSVMKKSKTMKRPAASTAQGKNVPLKRPASKAGSKKAEASKDEGDLDMEDPEEEHEFEQDTEIDFPEDEGKKTDRCKKQKFLQMVSNKELPEYILKEWERSKGLKSGRTEIQRNLINSIFDRTSAGKLLLSLAKPQFETLKESYKDTCSIQSNRALSKTLFMGKFNLNKELFQEGLEAGDFFEIEDESGKKTYSWVEKNQQTKVGDLTKFGSKAAMEVSSQDAVKLHSISKNWKQGLFKSIAGASSGSRALGPPALMDANAPLTQVQWKDALVQLEECMSAFDKCEKEALKCLQLIGVESTSDSLHPKLPLGCIFSYPSSLYIILLKVARMVLNI